MIVTHKTGGRYRLVARARNLSPIRNGSDAEMAVFYRDGNASDVLTCDWPSFSRDYVPEVDGIEALAESRAATPAEFEKSGAQTGRVEL